MKAVILAGGYGTRLLPLTKYVPKALLPVAGMPVVDYHIEQLIHIGEIEEIVVSTNACFEEHFKHWWQRLPDQVRAITRLAIEPSLKEEQKLGAVRGLQYVIETQSLNDSELLVTAGDNLFGFQLQTLVDVYHQYETPTVAFCDLKMTDKVKGKYGVGMLGEDGRILAFQEKPEKPVSTMASTGCYIFTPSLAKALREYTAQTNNSDALGRFIDWYSKRSIIRGFVFDGYWFDIGSFESYEAAIKHFAVKTGTKVGIA
jgi:glucose-1-phosphate thymidylyltransferase